MTNNSPLSYPKSLRENKEWRAKLLIKSQEDEKLQGYIKEACSRNFLYWCNLFAWTYNPRLTGEKYIPFILYDFQEETAEKILDRLENAKDGETLVVEKCRDMGVTWLVLAIFYWFWLYRENSDFIIGSRKEEYVDKQKKPDTLFGKLEILIKKTPEWMLPKGFDRQKHSTHLSLRNPENGSMIKGESSNADFSRSGRYKAALMDEMAFWNNSATAHSAASESCNLIIPVSTPNPEGSGYFKRLVDDENVENIRLVHTMHPDKGPEWLKEQYKKKSPEIIAVEILIDYMGAITGKVYSRAMQCPISDKYDYDPELPLYRAWDFGHGGADATVILWLQKDEKTNTVRVIDCYQKSEEDINFFAPIAKGRIEKSEFIYTEDELEEMERRKLWRPATDFGDPYDTNTRTFVKQTTIAKELAKHGINMNIKTGTKVGERIDKARLLFKRLVWHPRALPALEMIASARFPSRNANSQSTSSINLPVHDDTSHFRTALEYFADNEPDISNAKKQKQQEDLAAATNYANHTKDPLQHLRPKGMKVSEEQLIADYIKGL